MLNVGKIAINPDKLKSVKKIDTKTKYIHISSDRINENKNKTQLCSQPPKSSLEWLEIQSAFLVSCHIVATTDYQNILMHFLNFTSIQTLRFIYRNF